MAAFGPVLLGASPGLPSIKAGKDSPCPTSLRLGATLLLARDLGGACTLCAHLVLVYKHVDEAELDYQAVSTLLYAHVYFGNNDYGIFCAYAGRRRAQVCCSGDPPSPHRGPCKRLAIDRTPCASCSSPCVRLRRVRCFRYALYTPCHVLSFRIPYILYSNQ